MDNVERFNPGQLVHYFEDGGCVLCKVIVDGSTPDRLKMRLKAIETLRETRWGQSMERGDEFDVDYPRSAGEDFGILVSVSKVE